MRQAQAGRREALDELVTEHLPLVYNIIGRALAGHPDVDDVVQETMLRAIRGLPGLREPDRFRSWLVAIAYRQIQLYLRSRRATRMRRLPEAVEIADPDFADRATAEIVVADQRRELIEAASWLDDGDRRLLGLWWQEASGELTRGELAEALDVRPKHAAVRVQRMKAQLDLARGVVRALHARPRCPELGEQLRRWNGVADPLWRKRLARHIRECPACGSLGGGLVAPEDLLLGMAALPVPAGLVIGASQVKLSLLGLMQHKTMAVAAATTVAVGGGLAYAVYHETLPPGGETVTVTPTLARSAQPGVAGRVAPTPFRKEIVVAPNGSDDGDGSSAQPLATLGKAVSIVRPGQTISLRGGTYRLSTPISITTSGTADEPIVLRNYRDERPVLDASGISADKWAITQHSSWWAVQGLEIKNSRSHAYVCSACTHMQFRGLAMHGNARSGLMLRDPGTADNQVLNSDFYDNGTGLSIQFGDGDDNLVRGNRAWDNDTSGYDLGDFGSPVTLEYNWAYRNTHNGFALAGGTVAAAHSLRHDVAWDNGGPGFTDDGAGASISLVNSTAFRNGGAGFALPNGSPLLRSDVAVGNKTPATLSGTAVQSRNDWAATFRSTDPTSAEGPRRADGSLPRTDFLVTGNGTGASMGG
ncbi:sigma-70 family RNA polymerase sigma factor [Paractinoplanes globisporus]|uniref:RNA polymerase sigma factor n=1 Tax=Paractinoplanes globisporus TaxID=113565 RepID=A0ABW6WCZ7_9ACTN|nr:sigma-70 family RNA polymerase sigma factor [Actinoplanes globisporus]